MVFMVRNLKLFHWLISPPRQAVKTEGAANSAVNFLIWKSGEEVPAVPLFCDRSTVLRMGQKRKERLSLDKEIFIP